MVDIPDTGPDGEHTPDLQCLEDAVAQGELALAGARGTGDLDTLAAASAELVAALRRLADHERTQRQRACELALARQLAAESHRLRASELNAALHRQMAETELLRLQMREQALHDTLTGLNNRRVLFETAPGLLELARRQGKPMCTVLIDLDHFRHLNEEHGHAAGDRVLQSFAALLQRTVRRSDMVCRYNGEEFVAVLSDIDAEGAHLMLARLLERWLDEAVEHDGQRLPPGSFSAGIALFPQHGDTLPLLLQRADMALYAAKGLGRARIEIASAQTAATMN